MGRISRLGPRFAFSSSHQARHGTPLPGSATSLAGYDAHLTRSAALNKKLPKLIAGLTRQSLFEAPVCGGRDPIG